MGYLKGDRVFGRTVIAVEPCRGKYTQWFDCVLTLSSPYTHSGTIQMAARMEDRDREIARTEGVR